LPYFTLARQTPLPNERQLRPEVPSVIMHGDRHAKARLSQDLEKFQSPVCKAPHRNHLAVSNAALHGIQVALSGDDHVGLYRYGISSVELNWLIAIEV